LSTGGAQAEAQAAALLQRAGAEILCRNFRSKRGEIDLIALHEGWLLFVEVRLRSHRRYEGAAASVDWRKQRRLILAAQYFLLAQPQWRQYPCRFDVVAFEPRQSHPGNEANWIKAAFTT